MKKTYYIFLFFSFIFCQFLSAQPELFRNNFNEYKDFSLSKQQVKELQKEGELIIFNRDKHTTRFAKKLFSKKVGRSVKEKTRTGKEEYEVIARKKILHYRINYIFFDGDENSYQSIEKSRQRMLNLLEKDYNFESIARQYSMDQNRYKGGDSGWFKIESVNEDFKNAITNTMRYADEVFRVDLPEQNWYYLVKKSYSPQKIEEILVIKHKK
ncbi:peptidylprolyl isomerase [Psychroflexus sp. ALD_RP9]|uniref:peptidylprolyl isomerase n=1 Tax=Psychroflexus sp. ALD_RP9 TaxID=2777186 RepID=UPI001A8C85D4|nr:peptidylprolyl isomerase [Psychroflexus sp. ALD_RP9]QSS97313.1 peptidylprolyl isomerase [Psychroflexus sp. ALD_RP9]